MGFRFMFMVMIIVTMMLFRAKTMVKSFEIYAPFAPDRSFCVVAIQSPRYGFCISRQQLLLAKRRMQIPDWSTVHLRDNGVDKSLTVVSYKSDDCEVITCVS